jgi:hypothetical protein
VLTALRSVYSPECVLKTERGVEIARQRIGYVLRIEDRREIRRIPR